MRLAANRDEAATTSPAAGFSELPVKHVLLVQADEANDESSNVSDCQASRTKDRIEDSMAL